MAHKGHYGEYSGNAKWSKDHAHTRVTKENYAASERDDASHAHKLKADIDWDAHHGHSDIDMTADEKHISKLYGDMKYDKKHHGLSRNHSEGKQIRSAVKDLRKAHKLDRKDNRNNIWVGEDSHYGEIKDLHQSAKETYSGLSDKGKAKAHKKMGRTLGYGKQWVEAHGEGPSRKSRSERLRDRAMKRSERTGAEWGDYDYEDPKVQKMLEKARELDERSGKEMKMTMTKTLKPLPKKKV